MKISFSSPILAILIRTFAFFVALEDGFFVFDEDWAFEEQLFGFVLDEDGVFAIFDRILFVLTIAKKCEFYFAYFVIADITIYFR